MPDPEISDRTLPPASYLDEIADEVTEADLERIIKNEDDPTRKAMLEAEEFDPEDGRE